MEWPELTPIKERVNVQADSARIRQIVDGCWVAVGTNKSHAIQLDYSRPFQGQPSYRFELKQDDNTLEGYSKEKPKVAPNYAIAMPYPTTSKTIRQMNIPMLKR